MEVLAGIVAGAVSVVLGVLVLRRRGPRLVGWLLIAHGASTGLLLGLQRVSVEGRAGLITDQLGQGTWVFLFLWLVLIAYVLPDGRAAGPRWRLWIGAGLGGTALFLVGAAGDGGTFAAEHGGTPPPLPGLVTPVSQGAGVVGLVLVLGLLFGSLLSLRQRLRAAKGEFRKQLLWPVWGGLAVPAVLVLGWVNHFLLAADGRWFGAALLFLGVALPTTIAISVVRHRLFDIELVLSRTVTYVTLTVLVVGVYAGLLALAERALGDSALGGLLAVGVTAIAVHPTYSWLRTRVERWVYGLRSDPHEAVRLLLDRVSRADQDGLIAALTDAVRLATRAARVRVVAPEAPRSSVHEVTLTHRGQLVGRLALDLQPGRVLTAADEALLHDLAAYAAVIVRAEQLNDELRDSRRHIVSAREEERRRMRRDLHDGLGPSLAALVLRLDAVASRTDEHERSALVAETRDEVKGMVAEVRRLVDELRPAAIDEVGLLGALRQRAASLTTDRMVFEVSGSDHFPPLPAAVEVATFRIASEAMTNAARHSGGTRCRVDLTSEHDLDLLVADNGTGVTGQPSAGVGWTSMRARAAELGGRCTIANRPNGGLEVHARLPLHPGPRAPTQEATA